MTPALTELITDNDMVVGYVSKAGQVLSNNEFDEHLIPDNLKVKVMQKIRETGLFFYDLVPSNIIKLDDGQLSLIDLESVYDLDNLDILPLHNAQIKPSNLLELIEQA